MSGAGFEAKLILATIIGGLTVMGAMAADRREPVEQIENVAVGPVRPGEDAIVRSTVLRSRNCFTRFERMTFDGARIRYYLEPQEFSRPGALGKPDTFQQRVPIPKDARPGAGTIRFVISWQCNPAHQLAPVTRTIDIPIEILPVKL